MDKQNVPKTDYSKIAEYYDKVRSDSIDFWLEKIIRYGEFSSGNIILDIGCGTGQFAATLNSLNRFTVCGLDSSVDMLRHAQNKSRDILWILGSGQVLPFHDNLFDCVYMTFVIHHLDNKEQTLQEVLRVLRRNGKCVVMTISHNQIRKSVLRYFPQITAIDLNRFPSLLSLRGSMIEIGFSNVHYHIVKRCDENIPTNEYLEKVRKRYSSTLTLLSKEAFHKGYKIFEKRVRQIYGTLISRSDECAFVVGHK